MKSTIPIDDVVAENRRRNESICHSYDPIKGVGAVGERITVERKEGVFAVPKAMIADDEACASLPWHDFEMLRFRHDFEYWCAKCVTIKDKITSRNVKFRLNAPQRRVLGVLESMRTAGRPIRMIMLKARQWGGSTLVQVYMAWIQIVLRRNWNSLICGHLRDTASAIRGMYSKLLRDYPKEYWEEDDTPQFKSFEKSRNVSEVLGRNCVVIAGTAGSQEAARGYDISMSHLTEVAFWPTTEQKSPESLVRAVAGSIMLEADTMIVMESTANGMGNFFHAEWLRSKCGFSDKVAVFVPWYEIEIYRKAVDDAEDLWNSLDDYEMMLWEMGLTLEMINWYHCKRKEYNSHGQMKAEYPTNDVEAFAHSGDAVFNELHLAKLRGDCQQARTFTLSGDAVAGPLSLNHLRMEEASNGQLKVWKQRCLTKPSCRSRYVVAVDVGGLSDKADYSVIAVIDRQGEGGLPEIVAQWRGHTYHDHLAWRAAQVAKWWHNALLVIESNTLETEHTEGDGGNYVLDLIRYSYPNLYFRDNDRPGFHTNKKTKEMVIFNLIGMVRDHQYIERDDGAVDEMGWYEHKQRGAYGAISGKHDDILMTRAIGLLVARELDIINLEDKTAIAADCVVTQAGREAMNSSAEFRRNPPRADCDFRMPLPEWKFQAAQRR